MLQALVSSAGQLLTDFNRSLLRSRKSVAHSRPSGTHTPDPYDPLERVLLTDGVGRTLFDEFAAHRAQARGDEETGWILMGLRERNQAIVLATLPAGAERDASVAHVRFNSTAQAVGSRIVRQVHRRLTMLGVVHTHPGSLRHPSDGDYRGDHQWVRNLRGGEGVFGIGTADGESTEGGLFAQQPRPNVQCMGELLLSWYSLRQDDVRYRSLPVELTLGPDVARPLHSIWSVVERHAEQLERIFRQQSGVTFEVLGSQPAWGLAVNLPLAERGQSLRVVLEEDEIGYYVERDGQLLKAGCAEERVDRGIYLLLAELAAEG